MLFAISVSASLENGYVPVRVRTGSKQPLGIAAGKDAGVDLSPWRDAALARLQPTGVMPPLVRPHTPARFLLSTGAPSVSAPILPFGRNAGFLSPAQRPALRGGVFDPATALLLMNSHFFVSVRDGEVGIFRIEDEGTITFLAMEQFALLLANIFVQINGSSPEQAGKTMPNR